jgi:integrase
MVQEYMRHRNIATTMLYIGEVDYVGSEAMQMMADRLEIPLLVPQEVLTVQ